MALSVLSLVVWLVVRTVLHQTMIDLAVYRLEGAAFRHGHDVYGSAFTAEGLSATYPPFAVVLFVPLSFLSWPLMQVLAVVANIVLLVVVSRQSYELAGGREAVGVTSLLIAAIALWAEPVFTTLRYGQINLLLLAVILWDFARSGSPRWRGVGIGLAAAIKITPAVFVVYALLTRRYRMAFTAMATFAVVTGLSAIFQPGAWWRYWSALIWDSQRVGRPENAANQSLRGVLVRIYGERDIPSVWSAVIALCFLVGMAAAGYVGTRLGDAWGLPVAAVIGLLCGPVSWTHHWVWCVPIVVLLRLHANRWWLVPSAVFWVFAVWAIPHADAAELHLAWWQVALSGWYVLFGLAFVALAVRRAAVRPAPAQAMPHSADRASA